MAGTLYAAGADGNQLLADKDANLSQAAKFGLTDLSRYLISNGADVNGRAHGGWNALDIAIKYGHTEMAELLESYGAVKSLP